MWQRVNNKINEEKAEGVNDFGFTCDECFKHVFYGDQKEMSINGARFIFCKECAETYGG